MTEKEKRDSGKLYDGNYNPEMLQEREKAKDLCFLYNSIKPSEKEKRKEVMKQI